MPPYKATHIPYGLTDPTKRTIRNPGIGDEAEFKKYGIETGGEYFLAETSVQPLGGVPIHRHHTYGELITPIEGEIGVVGHNGTKTMTLSKDRGESYSVKPGEWHRFFNPSKTERIIFQGKVTPGHQGFEKLLHIFYGLVEDGYGTPQGFPSSTFHLHMLSNMGEVSYPGWGGWFNSWLAKVVGLIARWSGEEERLTQKYYGRPITEEEKRKWKVA